MTNRPITPSAPDIIARIKKNKNHPGILPRAKKKIITKNQIRINIFPLDYYIDSIIK